MRSLSWFTTRPRTLPLAYLRGRAVADDGSSDESEESDSLDRDLVSDIRRQWYFVFVSQHSISDGWSRRLREKELTSAYAAFSAGKVPDLPPPSIQYADYAAWQQDWLGSEDAARSAARAVKAI